MRLMQQNGLNRAAAHGNDRQQPRSADFSEPCQEYRADNWNQFWVADITYIAIDADCRHPIRQADRLGADRPEYETTGGGVGKGRSPSEHGVPSGSQCPDLETAQTRDLVVERRSIRHRRIDHHGRHGA
jgi:hypothetical protein